MKNRYKLSKYNAAFLEYDDYDNNDRYISATTLLKPTREILINRLWKSEPFEDVSDKIAMKIGTGVHNLRESTPYSDCLMREERLFCSLEKFGIEEFGISGKPDLVDFDYNQPQIESDDGLVVIEDLKVSSLMKLKFGDFSDYILQLSILKYLALRDEQFGNLLDSRQIKQVEESFSKFGIITFMAKDWSSRNSDLMPIPIQEIPLELIDDSAIEKRIERKCREIQTYWHLDRQEQFPLCSDKIIQKYNGKNCLKYCSARFNCQKSPVFEGQVEKN